MAQVQVPIAFRRTLTVTAGIGLLAGLSVAWLNAADTSRLATMLITAGFLTVVLVAVLAFTAEDARTLDRLDVVLLVIGVVVLAAQFRGVVEPGFRYMTDEGELGSLATHAVIHGHNPYVLSWSSIARHPGSTPLMGGGVVTRFAYPPLSLLLGAFLHLFASSLATPAASTGLALAVTGILCFVLLPRGLRAVAVLAVLGLDLLVPLALNGHLVIVALPFICAAVYRWTAIGTGGRLGVGGLVRAICAGLAAATQQLTWFPIVLLLLAIWLVRRGDLPARRALAVTGRFGAVVAVTFLAPNLPFLLAAPHAWASAMASVFTQHAVVYGQGLIALTTVGVGDSGALQFYSYATVLLAVAFLLLTAVGFRRIARALPVLATVLFIASTRSESDYFVVLIPLWLVWAITADGAVIDAARPLFASAVERWLPTGRRRAIAAVATFVPVFGCVAVAVATPAPLTVRPAGADLSGSKLSTLTLVVHNDSGQAMYPRFFVDTRSRIRSPWHVLGAARIPAHASRTLRIAPDPTSTLSLNAPQWVFATTGDPLTFRSVQVRLRPDEISRTGPSGGPSTQLHADCLARLLTGQRTTCTGHQGTTSSGVATR